MYRVRLQPNAASDMAEIGQYIAQTLRSPTSAYNLKNKFHKGAQSLSNMPYRCPAAQLSKSFKQQIGGECRKLRIDNYLMLYQINEEEKVVSIMRVIYGRRDYLKKSLPPR